MERFTLTMAEPGAFTFELDDAVQVGRQREPSESR
jgi:hypothetical protein